MEPVIARLSFPDAAIELRGDPCGRVFGFRHSIGLPRTHLSARIREDIACWKAIQRERRRLGLPPLETHQMPVG